LASTLSTLPAERATVQEWRGTNVTVAQVLGRLSILRAQAEREEALDQDNPHPRNSVMDLIVVASDPDVAERAANTIASLAAHHPCRAIIVLDEPGGESRIDATVTSYSHQLVESANCLYEQVFLRARGAAAGHIPSLVEALLISDVTTYLWWTGSPPFKESRFSGALAIADVLILDTSLLERPYEGFLELAEMDRRNPGVSVGDMQWARVRPWREILAQFFNPTDRRGFLSGIRAVEIDYVARGSGNRSAAVLLAGWLATSLGWRLTRAARGAGGIVVAHLESPAAHAVEIAMRPVERDGFVAGDILAVRLEAVRGSEKCSMTSHRDVEHRDQVTTAGAVADVDLPSRSLTMPSLDDASLINQLVVSARGDEVFKRSLEAAAGLKAALR
jgi:glucose-6-phosphate dehydrogenase assembly protein OpcA